MGRKGICSLCLEYGDLTFEHIPPRRVFNDKPTVAHTLYGFKAANTYKKQPKPSKRSQGLGKHTLCARCNGKTADDYGDAFCEWTIQCLRFAERIDGAGNGILLPFHIRPLNVIKQIIAMAIATSALTASAESIDALRQFVLCKNRMVLPPEYHVRIYFNPSDSIRARNPLLTQNRLSEMCAVMDTRTGKSVFVLGEVAFPPMGYVVFSSPEDEHLSMDFNELCDIRMFKNYYYGQRTSTYLSVPVRFPFGPVPGYYPNIITGNTQYLTDDYVLLT